jgi:hypothetical protein
MTEVLRHEHDITSTLHAFQGLAVGALWKSKSMVPVWKHGTVEE